MLEQTLRDLDEAVRALDNEQSLSILNINEGSLDSPETTREFIARWRAWTQLRNIAKSIPDLLSQSDQVALVGFLGHFSSGKSSLINALLGVSNDEDPGYKREVGQHPTDTGITLITHRDHAQSVRQSAYTVIDAVEVVHGPALEFLEHAILVDTPGLGNERAELEAVTRFLHLCHVLVITIDGRRPFADKEKDFALLDIAFNQLAGVPKVIVVTSAEEFLTSRTASFETGWQANVAEVFWEEAVERLRADPRFLNHLGRFERAQRFFVDSKEGFRVDQVRDALLPIVTDDGQRARIREAQGRYVLATAARALEVLLGYIATRSANLNRLLTEAQSRADGTAIAVEDLLGSLELSLGSIRQRLQESRQQIPTGAFAVEAIVTPQAIDDAHGSTLRRLEGEIREGLKRQLIEAREPTWRRVRRHYMARTRGWSPTTAELDVDTLRQGSEFEVDVEGTGLGRESIKCARAMIRVVNQQVAAAVASSVQHLRNPSDAWEIGTCTRDVEVSLERFERVHDDSVRSFYAYVSAPNSSDLLEEHGFVGFDEYGGQAVRTESIDAVKCRGFVAIAEASESCKERLRLVREEEPGDEGRTGEDGGDELMDGDEFGKAYHDHVTGAVNTVCKQGIEVFVSGLSERVEHFVEEVREERTRVATSRRRIWRARRTLLGRLVLVAVVIAVVVFAFALAAPGPFAEFRTMLSDWLFEAFLVGSLSTVSVVALGYVLSGAKNENVRNALRLVLVERWAIRTKRRGMATALKAYFDESYNRLVGQVDETQLVVSKAMADGVLKSLKEHSDSYREAEKELSGLRELILRRCELLDEFIGVVNQQLNGIPKELRDSASGIKARAIEAHMARIREAAGSVEDVKSEVERIAAMADGAE